MGDDGKSLRKWCFTITNYTEEDEQNLLDELTPDKVVYAIVGREKGESGTPHLQGYVYFKRRLKMSTAKATLGKTARLEPARGTPEQNEQYCSKDGDILLRIGVLRTEYKEFFQALQLWPWQKALFDELQQTPDFRTIIWYEDLRGNCGKSYLAAYLRANSNAIIFGPKDDYKDIAYKYTGQRIVIFHMPRSAECEKMLPVMEQLKSGSRFSGKYESEGTKIHGTTRRRLRKHQTNTGGLQYGSRKDASLHERHQLHTRLRHRSIPRTPPTRSRPPELPRHIKMHRWSDLGKRNAPKSSR